MGIHVNKPEIEKASLNDYEELKTLISRANNYSISVSGFPQWTKWDVVFKQLETQLVNDEMFVIRNANGAITSAISIDESDEEWGDRSVDNLAIYIHQLMKDPSLALPYEGNYLINFAAVEAQKRDKSLIRCDTAYEIKGLIGYYERLGFVQSGTFIYESTGRAGVLLEAKTVDVLQKSVNLISKHD